ncbi:MAG: gfo/Idh/MocA family oxidoreductase, partial [Sphingobacteriaceae bacterium]
MDRRDFVKSSAIGLAGLTILPSGTLFGKSAGKVRLGYIGVGLRGRNHINEGLLRDDVEIVAICDIQESSLKYCRKQFVDAKKKLPAEYTGGVEAYKK